MSADLVVLAAALLLVLDGVHIVHHHGAVGLARAAANRIENRNEWIHSLRLTWGQSTAGTGRGSTPSRAGSGTQPAGSWRGGS